MLIYFLNFGLKKAFLSQKFKMFMLTNKLICCLFALLCKCAKFIQLNSQPVEKIPTKKSFKEFYCFS